MENFDLLGELRDFASAAGFTDGYSLTRDHASWLLALIERQPAQPLPAECPELLVHNILNAFDREGLVIGRVAVASTPDAAKAAAARLAYGVIRQRLIKTEWKVTVFARRDGLIKELAPVIFDNVEAALEFVRTVRDPVDVRIVKRETPIGEGPRF